MERRSERLAKLQRERPISYRETGVRSVFKKIHRKRTDTAVKKKQECKAQPDSCLQSDCSFETSDLDDQPCCSKDQPDQQHVLLTHTAESKSIDSKAGALLGRPVDVEVAAGSGQQFDSQQLCSANACTVSQLGSQSTVGQAGAFSSMLVVLKMPAGPSPVFLNQRSRSLHTWPASQHEVLQPKCKSGPGILVQLLTTHTAGSQSNSMQAGAFLGMPLGVQMPTRRGPVLSCQRPCSAYIWPVSQPVVLQPKCKSGPGIFVQLLTTHAAGSLNSGAQAGAFSGTPVSVKMPARSVNLPRPMMMVLSLLLLLLLGFFLVSCAGFQNVSPSLSDSQYMQLLESQLSHENEARQQYLKKEADALRQKVTGLQSLKDAFVDVNEEIKLQFMEVDGSGAANRYILRKDFALKSAGASVINSSQSYSSGAKLCMWGFCWEYSRSADVILERDNVPGNCWAMNGSEGYVVIKLSQEICPTNVILDHISRKVSHTGEISSAPKDFSVYGLKDISEEQEETFLGTFSYVTDDFSTQTFNLQVENSEKFKYLQIKILSNWGHPNYTCIYGIRVYGKESGV